MSKELATVSEPFITRRDALGNIRRVLFSEFKRQCCPSGVSDGAALSFMRACDVLGAIPEIKDIELAIMKGKPVLVIREQMYLKNLRRRYSAVLVTEKCGLLGPDGKRKAMNAKPEPDDIGWHEFYAGGEFLGRFEGVRREWDRGKEPDSAWARQPNHMLLVRVRCHNAKRVAPLEVPEPGGDAPVEVELVDEGMLEVEPAALAVADEGEEPLDVAVEEEPEEAAPGAVTPPATAERPETPVPAESPASAEESPAGEAPAPADPFEEEAPKPAMTDEQLRFELAGEAKRVFGEGQAGYQRFLAWAGKKHGTDVKSLKGIIANLRASAESSLEQLRQMKDGELVSNAKS